MLITFELENMYSYLHKDFISLESKGAVRSHHDNYAQLGKRKVMKLLSLYGSNSAGKSNLFKSIFAATEMIKTGDVHSSRSFSNFHNSEDISFKFEFYSNRFYEYSVVLCEQGIREEKLSMKSTTSNKNAGYEELYCVKYNFTTELGASLELVTNDSILKPPKGFKNKIEEVATPRKVFLKILEFYFGGIITDAYNFFEKIEMKSGYSKTDLFEKLKFKTNYRDILQLIKLADSNIDDISISDEEDSQIIYKYSHSKKIQESEQSSGTNEMAYISPLILDVLKRGGVLVIDEVDAFLHTVLVKALIYIFNSPDININNAQLIFNTHNQMLLDSRIFRSDQIWFVEKNDENTSELYCLKDIDSSEKNSKSYVNAYFRGEYGAIPYYDIDALMV